MRKYYVIIIGLLAATILAQSVTSPVPVDWRYVFQWDDPNPAGQVASWTAFASNNVSVRVSSTRTTFVDCAVLLSGAPAGAYALFVIPTTTLGDTGEVSTNIYVSWPGGSGKTKGGGNLHVNK